MEVGRWTHLIDSSTRVGHSEHSSNLYLFLWWKDQSDTTLWRNEELLLVMMGPTCHYDVIDFVLLPSGTIASLSNKHKMNDVIMAGAARQHTKNQWRHKDKSVLSRALWKFHIITVHQTWRISRVWITRFRVPSHSMETVFIGTDISLKHDGATCDECPSKVFLWCSNIDSIIVTETNYWTIYIYNQL